MNSTFKLKFIIIIIYLFKAKHYVRLALRISSATTQGYLSLCRSGNFRFWAQVRPPLFWGLSWPQGLKEISSHSITPFCCIFFVNTDHHLKLLWLFVYSFIISFPPLELKVHMGPCLFCSLLWCQHLQGDSEWQAWLRVDTWVYLLDDYTDTKSS